jgi:3alpha(or 20beta)-hydroxysteroid dehydrogenase
MIDTPLTATAPQEEMAQAYPIPRFGRPEEVAAMMVWIVCEGTYATGCGFPVDAGILSGIPFGG